MPAKASPDGFSELSWLLGISAESLAALLPQPVWSLPGDFAPGCADDVTWWLAAGDQVLVVVGVGIDALTVGVPKIRWASQDAVVELVHFEVLTPLGSEDESRSWFREQVGSAIHRRRSGFRRCQRCNNLVAPERMFGGGTCQVCAQDDGIVF